MFGGQPGGGAPSGAGELLFSNGGLSRNESGSSGGANAAPQAAGPGGLGSGASSFDLSNDFPTLGGGGGGGGTIGGGGAVGGGAGGLGVALRQQQMLQAQQQQYRIATAGQGAINIAAEDFPALPGSGSGGGTGGGAPASGPSLQQRGAASSNPPSSSSSPFLGSRASSAGLDSTGANNDAVIGAGAAGGASSNGSNPLFNGLSGGLAGLSISGDGGSGSGSGTRPSSGSVGGGGSSNPSSSAPTTTATTSGGSDGAPGSAINSDYGLLGLLSIIRMTDADRSALALGQDLSTLGLDLKTSDNLFDKFGGPFTDKPATSEPHYNIPMCYYMNPPALKTGHLSKFTLEILFYIFYAMPKDVLQAYAAQELYSREWRYHVDLKLWFKQAAPGDGVDLSDGSAKYIYFDYQTWDRRHFSGNVQQIVGGFLSEEDVRVKFPSS